MDAPRLSPLKNSEFSGDRVNNFRTELTMTPGNGPNEWSMLE